MNDGGPSLFSDMVVAAEELDQGFPSSGGFQRGTQEEKGKEQLILQEENDKENIIGKDNTNSSETKEEKGKEQLILQEENDKENIISNDNINPSGNGIEMLAVESNNLFHEDFLSIITKKLDFDDVYFPFGAVCHDWRDSLTTFIEQIMASPAPLMMEMSKPWDGIVAFSSFIDGSFYKPKLPSLSANVPRYTRLKYLGFSRGNMIIIDMFTKKFFLVNPFTRKKIEIRELVLPTNLRVIAWDHVILAYAVGSEEEFTIVVMSKPYNRLFSYQSRNDSWMCYDRHLLSQHVVDVVVLHRALYAINVCGQIGVVSLNTPRVKYIHQIKNAPKVRGYKLKLVVSEGKLLVVQFKTYTKFEIMVYRIDFSAMEWVRMQSLENCALFLSKSKRCYALSKPDKFGYLSNHVYYVDGDETCKVYRVDGDFVWSTSRFPEVQEYMVPPMPVIGKPGLVDWCFMTFREEVDYSLDD